METEKKPNSHTVIVIGSGLAGLCAALEALSIGSNIVIVEKNPK